MYMNGSTESKQAVYRLGSHRNASTVADRMYTFIADDVSRGADEGTPAIRVLIADDHQLLRQGYTALLARSGGFLVVGEARDGAQAIDLAVSSSPDVVLMDIQMPRMNGLRAIEEIHRRLSQTLILVISMMNEAAIIRQCLKNGAQGFISKDDSFDELVTAIHSICQGNVYLGRRTRAALASEE